MNRRPAHLWTLLAAILLCAAAQAQSTQPDYTTPDLVFEEAEPIQITSMSPPDQYGRFQVYFVTNAFYNQRVAGPKGAPRDTLAEAIRDRILADPTVAPQLSDLQRVYMHNSRMWLAPNATNVPVERFPNYMHWMDAMRGHGMMDAPVGRMYPCSFIAASAAEARLLATKIIEYTNAHAQEQMAALTAQLAREQEIASDLEAKLTATRQQVTQAQAAVDAATAQVTVPDYTAVRDEFLAVHRDLQRLAVDLAGSEARATAITRLRQEKAAAPIRERLDMMLVEHDVDLAELLARQATLTAQRDRLRTFMDATDSLRAANEAATKLTSWRDSKRSLAKQLQGELENPSSTLQPVRMLDTKVVLRPIVVSKGNPSDAANPE